MSRIFYVQDERYIAVPWMARNVYFQPVRYSSFLYKLLTTMGYQSVKNTVIIVSL